MVDITPLSTGAAERVRHVAERVGGGTATPPSTTRGSDRVEVSQLAMYLSKLRALPDVRQDLIDEVRAQIAKGAYDTPEKLEAALGALLDELEA